MADRRPLYKIQLSDKDKEKIKREISILCEDESGEAISEFKADQYLDYLLENIAPVIYNRALEDAKHWFSENMGNLENEYYMLYRNE